MYKMCMFLPVIFFIIVYTFLETLLYTDNDVTGFVNTIITGLDKIMIFSNKSNKSDFFD